MIQKTLILDTNVYGELLIESKSQEIIKKIEDDNKIYLYGIDIIEKELEESPIDVKYKGKILQEAILSIYNVLIDEELKLFPVAVYLAAEYYKKFDQLRKSGKYYNLISSKVKKYTEQDLKVDFQIIAVASIKGVDIVVSTDKRTILSGISEDTYDIVNKENGLKTPNLVKYSDFKKRYINEK